MAEEDIGEVEVRNWLKCVVCPLLRVWGLFVFFVLKSFVVVRLLLSELSNLTCIVCLVCAFVCLCVCLCAGV